MVLNLLALFVLLVLVACVVLAAAWLGGLPGRVAKARSHPQADAINACGWIGLIVLGAPWVVAMVWAYTKPIARGGDEALLERLARLEEEVARLRGKGAAS